MVLDFLKKRPKITEDDRILAYRLQHGLTVPTEQQHTEAYERFKQQINQADQRLNTQTPTQATPETVKETPGPATKKPYNVAKDTALVRLHNDLINKIKAQKGDKTFNEFLSERLGL